MLQQLAAPGVEVHCLHGTGVKSTPGALIYTSEKDDWFDHGPTVVADNGDGTVNLRSLHGCLRWADKQSEPVHHHEFTGEYAEHLKLLQNSEVNAYIAKVLNS